MNLPKKKLENMMVGIRRGVFSKRMYFLNTTSVSSSHNWEPDSLFRILKQNRNLDGPFYIHIYFTSKSLLGKSYPCGSVLRCICCLIYVTVYLMEMYYLKPSRCLCCISLPLSKSKQLSKRSGTLWPLHRTFDIESTGSIHVWQSPLIQ